MININIILICVLIYCSIKYRRENMNAKEEYYIKRLGVPPKIYELYAHDLNSIYGRMKTINKQKYEGQNLNYNQIEEIKAGYIMFFDGLKEFKMGKKTIRIPFQKVDDLSTTLLVVKKEEYHSRMYMVLMRTVLYYMLKKCGFKRVKKNVDKYNITELYVYFKAVVTYKHDISNATIEKLKDMNLNKRDNINDFLLSVSLYKASQEKTEKSFLESPVIKCIGGTGIFALTRAGTKMKATLINGLSGKNMDTNKIAGMPECFQKFLKKIKDDIYNALDEMDSYLR